ncbi:MAG: hypothetical protein JO010_03355 [Alphaproteobacteria bacterium]|nr:hypothetical protein [Alphaproteobacteria bacterium]
MRNWPLVILGAALAAAAVPATAGEMRSHGHMSSHHHHGFNARRNAPFFFTAQSFARHRRFAGDRFGSFGFDSTGFVGLPWDDGRNGVQTLVVAAEPGMAVPVAMANPIGEARPTVEITADGVAVIRGPGSRHLAR